MHENRHSKLDMVFMATICTCVTALASLQNDTLAREREKEKKYPVRTIKNKLKMALMDAG